jgi:beta-barrel assembly-enhancing protease
MGRRFEPVTSYQFSLRQKRAEKIGSKSKAKALSMNSDLGFLRFRGFIVSILFRLSFFVLFAASCSSAPIQKSAEEMTIADEVRLMRETQPILRKDFPALQNAEIQTYVSMLGARIVAANDLVGKPYTYSFVVVESPMINAFALPAGAIYITKPLLQNVQSEAELAGVLGHEVAHVVARHASKRIRQAQEAHEDSWIYGVGGGVAGAALGAGAAQLLCGAGESVCISGMAAANGVLGAKSGLLVQKYKLLANHRENELEADRLGFQFAERAGFSASRLGDFYIRLKTDKTDSIYVDALSSHPAFAERMEALTHLKESGVEAESSSEEFAQMKARL